MYTYEDAYKTSLQYFNGDDIAADTWVKKYALQDAKGNYLEKSPEDMHRRLAREFARIEAKYPDPMTEDEIFELLRDFKYIVPQGSPMSGVGNRHKIQSLSNCFVIDSPEDSYAGILHTDQEQAQIMKRRGGVGFDISNIRPRGLPTNNAAKTTDGIGVFMERFSNTCREVAQGGRRGALMLTIDCHHPEIRTFINIKRNLTKVTGANISIRMSKEFMSAVEEGTDVQLRWPVESTTPEVVEMVDARKLWDEIVEAAHFAAEPGLLFWDNVSKYTPADIYHENGFKSVSTNPCITGDTLIAVADGRNAVSIRELAEAGVDVPVYCVDPESGQTQIKMGRAPRLTGRDKEIWEVTLDDGSAFKATPNHRVLTKAGYVEVQNLNEGDSIVPFNSFESNGYRQICGTGTKMVGGAYRNRRQYQLIHEFNCGETDAKEYAIHHVDFNSKNDKIDNLKLMTHEAHCMLHADKMCGVNNPYHRMTDEWRRNFASHPGESNGRYSGFTNEQLFEHGRALYAQEGVLTIKLWTEYAKRHGLPQFLGNDFRFGNFTNFKSAVINNHKVVSVRKIGNEDVYNITVDDNHNYCIITSGDEDYMNSSGVCIKNCGEICLSPGDSCRLMVVNLSAFVKDAYTPDAHYDWEHCGQVVRKAQRLMDDLIDLEIEEVDRIIEKIKQDPQHEKIKRIELELWERIRDRAVTGRRTGLGVTAVGDTVAMMNLKYGDEPSLDFVEELYRCLGTNSYKSSIEMARDRGAFPCFDLKKEEGHPFIDRILAELDDEHLKLYREFGRRNIANTTTAPCGSVSILTQTTSGIEPAIFLTYTRRKKINPNDPGVRVDFVDDLGDEWMEFRVVHHGMMKWLHERHDAATVDAWLEAGADEESDLLTGCPYVGATAMDIDWPAKVRMQGRAQKWVCHAISNTCNLPADITVDEVKDVYITAYKAGCKGVTIYRDGSRSGVLVKETDRNDVTAFAESHAPRRPEELVCEIHRTNIKNDAWTIFVGLYEGKPYEIFGGLSDFIEIPRKYTRGRVVKRSFKNGGKYDLYYGEGDEECKIKDIVKMFDNPNYSSFTRMLSLSLRHGAPIHYIVEQLQRDKDSDMHSFSRVMSRVLKKYVTDGTKSSLVCQECGMKDSLVYQEGCVTCVSCGSSKCG